MASDKDVKTLRSKNRNYENDSMSPDVDIQNRTERTLQKKKQILMISLMQMFGIYEFEIFLVNII